MFKSQMFKGSIAADVSIAPASVITVAIHFIATVTLSFLML